MEFFGKTAFVTGVAHGIGRAIALQLAEAGASLALADINAQGLGETARLARERGAQVVECPLDVTDEAAVRAAVQSARDALGPIDILVNNAGVYDCACDFVDSRSEEWKRKMSINILGTLYPTHAILPGMLERGYGRIVNIASVAGVYGIARMADYSMTKGAIIGFTHALAKEVTRRGVTVNAVSPGSIDVSGNPLPEHSFMGRAGTPEECANLVVFLASDRASYISGQNIQVDGCRKRM